MSKFSDLYNIITTQFKQNNKIAYLVLGKPGGGKSALSMKVVKDLGGTDENTVIFTPSLRDPVDVLGTPNNRAAGGDAADFTQWVPPKEFYKLRDDGTDNPKFLIIEELTDASMAMMNAMCRIVLDRMAGDLKLSRNLFIIGTGNRTEDKSGANRLSTKLGNRLNVQEFDENLDDWVDWAMMNGVNPILIQFLRFKPNLLSDFKADRPFGINPTPRQWEAVSNSAELDDSLFLTNIAGLVGEGAAAEYAAFRRIYKNLISFEDIVMHPDKVKIPTDKSALYAIVGSVAHHTTKGNVDRVAVFVDRLPSDFSVMYWQDTMKLCPDVKGAKAFIKWATTTGKSVLSS